MERPGQWAAVGRDEPHHHVRIREVGRLGHIDDIGKRDHAAPETHRGTVHRSHDRHPALDHVEDELSTLGDDVASQHAVVGHTVEEVEVATGRERAPLTGDHDRTRVGIRTELRKQAREAEVQLFIDRVELFRTVQMDDAPGPSDSTRITSGRSYFIDVPFTRSSNQGCESR